ncbi:hypothetical protein LBMAG56_40670 [Verrucomicrobiota bacterium]|nr:hypothetical protein LBMAG56_40670 [Verrucomicrobiota bacterium]
MPAPNTYTHASRPAYATTLLLATALLCGWITTRPCPAAQPKPAAATPATNPKLSPLTLPTNAKVLTQPTYLSLGVLDAKQDTYSLSKKGYGALLLTQPLGPGQAVEFNVTFTGGGTLYFRPGVNGTPTGNYNQDTARYSVGITCDKNGWSLAINGGVLTTVDDKPRWAFDKRRDVLTYWPALEKAQQKLIAETIAPISLFHRPIPVRVEYHPDSLTVYVDGTLATVVPGSDFAGPAGLYPFQSTTFSAVKVTTTSTASPFLQVILDPLANDRFSNSPLASAQVTESAGVPFRLSPGAKNMLNLKDARWIDAALNPSSYYEEYDNGAPFMHDPRQPMLRVPVADYTAAHVLAYAVTDPQTTPVVTFRAGSYDVRGQTLQHDFASVIPTTAELSSSGVRLVNTPLGKLTHTVIPFSAAFAQDLAARPAMEIEVTKEVRLQRRSPDPNRFRYRPQGLPSGVRIAAITFEKSPLQLKLTSGVPGHVFELPEQPGFTLALHNITATPRSYQLTIRTRHLDGDNSTLTADKLPGLKGTVAPGQTLTIPFPPGFTKLGYYDLAVDVHMPGLPPGQGNDRTLTRRTTYCVLPPDTRKHRATSPFGVWDFTGGHYSSADPDQVGPLYKKAGIRYGMFSFKPEDRAKYGVLCGNEPKIIYSEKDQSYTTGIDKYYERNTDSLKKVALILHEDSISGNHVQRVPDIFHDRPPYKLQTNDNPRLDEQKRFQDLFEKCVEGARAVKAKHPGIHLRLGNGPLPTKEELLRAKFPAELFDSLGNESGTYGRMPEAQPPDYVGFGSSLWMDRQLLDHYGYKDKPVTQCYEICYPNTNPGNLTPETQANYFIRHAMHSLIWGVPEIRMGCISDVGNSYRFSNWGASGILYKMPELNAKPSYVAYATLTRMLDGAGKPRLLETGSTSVYAVEFERAEPGTYITCVWNVNGTRETTFQFAGTPASEVIDAQGNPPASLRREPGGKLTLTAAERPCFLIAPSRIKSIQTLAPTAPLSRPEGQIQVLVPNPTGNSGNWQTTWNPVTTRDPELEAYNFMNPRRKADYRVETVPAEGLIPPPATPVSAVKVTPLPLATGKPTMPMYSTFALRQPVTLDGQPTSLAIQIKGNSGWGRIIFELRDASGQVWRSIGAPQRGELSPWLLDWMPKEMQQQNTNDPSLKKQADWNTDDVWGKARINFDGWKYLDFALPGTGPGDRTVWPGNSQWKFDKDGLVHYPLTLTGITVEIPEKVLKLHRFEPVKDPSIQFGEILAITRAERWLLPRSASAGPNPGFDRLPLELVPRESD